jgi:hypothetical protein
MLTIEVTCDTGKNWPTRFNGSLADAEGYFLNKTFTDETDDGREIHHKCVDVSLVYSEVLSPAWFEETLSHAPTITPQLRDLSMRICLAFNIRGICDPLYIANVAAIAFKVGDGASKFSGESVAQNAVVIDRLADRLAFAYASHINNVTLLRKILNESLGQTAAMH